MTGTHFTPRAIRLEHELIQRNVLDDRQVLFRLERAPIDANTEPHLDELPHLIARPRKGVHDAESRLAIPSYQLGQEIIVLQTRDEIAVRGARVQKQRQMHWQREHKRELLLKAEDLGFLRTVREAVVVEAKFPGCDNGARRPGRAGFLVDLTEGGQDLSRRLLCKDCR